MDHWRSLCGSIFGTDWIVHNGQNQYDQVTLDDPFMIVEVWVVCAQVYPVQRIISSLFKVTSGKLKFQTYYQNIVK